MLRSFRYNSSDDLPESTSCDSREPACPTPPKLNVTPPSSDNKEQKARTDDIIRQRLVEEVVGRFSQNKLKQKAFQGWLLELGKTLEREDMLATM